MAWALIAFLSFVYSGFGQVGDAALDARIATVSNGAPLDAIKALSDQIESLWPKQPLNYFLANDAFGTALDLVARTNSTARPDLVKAGQLLLAKPCPEDPLIRRQCFAVKELWLTRFVQATYLVPSLRTAQLMASALREAQGAIITNYLPVELDNKLPDPPILPTNPPQDINIPGTDPKSVVDPIARLAWEKAIRDRASELKSNLSINYLQQVLPMCVRQMKEAFYGYCHKLFMEDSDAKKYRAELGKAAGLTPAETGQLGMDF